MKKPKLFSGGFYFVTKVEISPTKRTTLLLESEKDKVLTRAIHNPYPDDTKQGKAFLTRFKKFLNVEEIKDITGNRIHILIDALEKTGGVQSDNLKIFRCS